MTEVKTEITEVARPSAPLRRFDKVRATQELADIVQKRLTNKAYDSEESSKLAKELADEIRAKIRIMSDSRFKICTNVSIVAQKGQGMRMVSRAYFDANTDAEITYVFSNEDIICVATLYAIYYY